MALSEGDRLRFREWLTNNGLDETVARAILESMAPHDWHEQATKADLSDMDDRLERRFDAIDHRFELVEQTMRNNVASIDRRFNGLDGRLDSMDGRFNSMDRRFDSLARDIRLLTFTVVGFMFTMLITMVGGGVTLLVS